MEKKECRKIIILYYILFMEMENYNFLIKVIKMRKKIINLGFSFVNYEILFKS